ncbi:MAG: hypothetical protein FJ109_18675 [Deltaproteobacteria bacterium]|nr:hypothetical protein [Deltaproteobacteria bacterium]
MPRVIRRLVSVCLLGCLVAAAFGVLSAPLTLGGDRTSESVVAVTPATLGDSQAPDERRSQARLVHRLRPGADSIVAGVLRLRLRVRLSSMECPYERASVNSTLFAHLHHLRMGNSDSDPASPAAV